MNELFGQPLDSGALERLAAGLGSDVNFFLQTGPALAFGRGERIEPLPPFTALAGYALWLFHPGFGVPTPWAFQQLGRFPGLRDGRPGRAAEVARRFLDGEVRRAVDQWFNALRDPCWRSIRSSPCTRTTCVGMAPSAPSCRVAVPPHLPCLSPLGLQRWRWMASGRCLGRRDGCGSWRYDRRVPGLPVGADWFHDARAVVCVPCS